MSKAIKLERADVNHIGSLMTYNPGDGETCIGYIFQFEGRSFHPNGCVEGICKEEADAHNAALSAAEIEGLDKCCEIGQCGTFYFKQGKVTTWIGTVVAEGENVTQTGNSLTFKRNGKKFRGRLRKNEDCFNFQRIS